MLTIYGLIELVVRWIVFAGRTNKVIVTYENGRRQAIRCKRFTVKANGQSIAWDSAYPQPLLMGVSKIVSIYAK